MFEHIFGGGISRMGHAPALVEARKDESDRGEFSIRSPRLALAGHVVKQTVAVLSGRVPFSRRLRRCDLAILFNGTHESYAAAVIDQPNQVMTSCLLNWASYVGTFQMDPDWHQRWRVGFPNRWLARRTNRCKSSRVAICWSSCKTMQTPRSRTGRPIF